jgi:hypothetical protein
LCQVLHSSHLVGTSTTKCKSKFENFYPIFKSESGKRVSYHAIYVATPKKDVLIQKITLPAGKRTESIREPREGL